METSLLFDTHCHLDYLVRAGEHLSDVLDRAKAHGVGHFLNPATCLTQLPDVLAAAEASPAIHAAVAIHPTDARALPDDWFSTLETALKHPKVVAIGETGLDYYREEDIANKLQQQQCFEALLHLARQHHLPVIIHDREAHEDIIAMVRACPGIRGVMHCFSGDTVFARQMIDLGFFISFAGNLTFKNAKTLQAVAADIPLEWLLVETDSPFLSPVPYRGMPNEPARVSHIAAFIASLRGLPEAQIIEQTTRNARQLFGV